MTERYIWRNGAPTLDAEAASRLQTGCPEVRIEIEPGLLFDLVVKNLVGDPTFGQTITEAQQMQGE